jgi:hypothetical protein
MNQTTRWWRLSLATRRKKRCLDSSAPFLAGLSGAAVMAVVSFGVNVVVDWPPFTSP